ncbi:unnamed protein product [Linum tenue]|uniref:Uncharacterized protein n=1 Tax=Linum tenue TaxID=586396 RepID=A0AAV0RUR9_9ROSI|nr:unnamed protein product [Linum tenue]
MISNDVFISVEHRVVAKSVGPRVSIASLFGTRISPHPKIYGPTKELVSEDNPPIYKETTMQNYGARYFEKGLDGSSTLLQFKLCGSSC